MHLQHRQLPNITNSATLLHDIVERRSKDMGSSVLTHAGVDGAKLHGHSRHLRVVIMGPRSGTAQWRPRLLRRPPVRKRDDALT